MAIWCNVSYGPVSRKVNGPPSGPSEVTPSRGLTAVDIVSDIVWHCLTLSNDAELPLWLPEQLWRIIWGVERTDRYSMIELG